MLAALDALGIALPANFPGLDDPDIRQVALEALLHRSVRESMQHHLSADGPEHFNNRRSALEYDTDDWSGDYLFAACAEALDLSDRLKVFRKYAFDTAGYQRIEQNDVAGGEGESELHAHLAWLGACLAVDALGLLSQPWNDKSRELHRRFEAILDRIGQRGTELRQVYREHWHPVAHNHRFDTSGLRIEDGEFAERLAEICGATDDECDTCREPALALLVEDPGAVADLFDVVARVWDRHPRQLSALDSAGAAWAFLLGPNYDPVKARAAIKGLTTANRHAMADFAIRMLCLGAKLDTVDEPDSPPEPEST